MRIPHLFGLHAEPRRGFNWLLALLPFIIIITVYVLTSEARLEANSSDKLLPSFSKMLDAVEHIAFTKDKRTGDYLLWEDTRASVLRLFSGVAAAGLFGLLVGMNMTLFPGMKTLCRPVVTFVSIIPPLALLPILFIAFGVGEFAKVMLIFFGTVWIITRDISLAVEKIPREQIVKSLTLGASELSIVYRVILPQIIPRLLDTMRLSMGAAWLFLIAAEAIASTEGLGYRIFLMRRYLAMEVIIPYVLWITFLGFALDWSLRKIILWKFSWYARMAE